MSRTNPPTDEKETKCLPLSTGTFLHVQCVSCALWIVTGSLLMPTGSTSWVEGLVVFGLKTIAPAARSSHPTAVGGWMDG